MAATVATYTTKEGSGTSIVIDKPTGLAVGNYMIAFLQASSITDKFNTPTGWTKLLTHSLVSSLYGVFFIKTADSSDVAASNFTFTLTSSEVFNAVLMRITGQSSSKSINVYSIDPVTVSDTKTPTITNTITPYNDSLILMVTSTYQDGGSAFSISNYAIETSNPTWTEVVDSVYTPASNSRGISVAQSNRPQSSATGNSSYIITSSAAATTFDTTAFLLDIPSDKNVTIEETVTISETLNKDLNIYFTDIVTFTETLIQSIGRVWNKITKPITTWINHNKN